MNSREYRQIVDFIISMALMMMSVLVDMLSSLYLTYPGFSLYLALILVITSVFLSSYTAFYCSEIFNMRIGWTMIGLYGKTIIVYAYIFASYGYLHSGN